MTQGNSDAWRLARETLGTKKHDAFKKGQSDNIGIRTVDESHERFSVALYRITARFSVTFAALHIPLDFGVVEVPEGHPASHGPDANKGLVLGYSNGGDHLMSSTAQTA